MAREDASDLRFHEQFARIGKAVGSPKRLQLLQVLAQGERSVEELAEETGTGMANTSGHLRVLRESGLVKTRREGTRIFYSLADDDVARFFVVLRDLARSRLAEVDQLLRSFEEGRGDESVIEPRELLELVEDERVTVVDIRPAEEYAAGHVPGALSLPLDELGERLDELPEERPVVVYGRGPYSSQGFAAVETLRGGGFEALRMAAGFPEWRLEGLPVSHEDDPKGASATGEGSA